MASGKLRNKRILILETREEAMFARMLREQEADVVQCPMFRIEDATDTAAVEAWIGRLIAGRYSDLVLLTGEGLRRLLKVTRRLGNEPAFVSALANLRKFARGPKPVRALREVGLEAQGVTEKPTSEGVLAMLGGYDLKARSFGVQLYPDKDHSTFIAAIEAMGASVETVSPYIYNAQAADTNILAAIDEMAAGKIDAIALTSSPQARRLFDVARQHGREDALRAALKTTSIASIGPVVDEELKSAGIAADITPANETYFMKPLISAMSLALNKAA
jgi:uroporphyrinogen-III synthase